MANELKGGRKRLTQNDKDAIEPVVIKKTRKVPEDQLKLERVLQSASKDSYILDHVKEKPKVSSIKKSQIKPNKNARKSKDSDGTTFPVKLKLNTPIIQQQETVKKKDPIKVKGKKTLVICKGNENDVANNSKLIPSSKEKISLKNTKNNPKGVKSSNKDKAVKRTKPISSQDGKPKLKPKSAVPSVSSKTQPKAAKEGKHKRTVSKSTEQVPPQKNNSPKVVSKHVGKPVPGKKSVRTDTSKKELKETPTLIPSKKKIIVWKDESDSDSDESDWEEVEEASNKDEKPQLPSEPVTITLQGPDLMHKKRKKGQLDLEDLIRRRINSAEQELQLQMHKVHLLCLLSHGFHRNRTCKDSELLAYGLSVLPGKLTEREYIHWDGGYLSSIVKWFHGEFTLQRHLKEDNLNLKQTLIRRFVRKEAASEAELVFMMVIILRSLGARVRFVLSLQPVSHKRPKLLKSRNSKLNEVEKAVKPDLPKKEPPKPLKAPPSKPAPVEPDTEVMAILKQTEGAQKLQKNVPKDSLPSSSSTTGNKPGIQEIKSLKRRSCASKITYEESDDEKDLLSPDTKSGVRRKSGLINREIIELISSDSEFEELTFKMRKGPLKSKELKKKKPTKKTKSAGNKASSSEDIEVIKVVKKEKGNDYFLEVYLERAESWIPVDCINYKVNNAREIESYATQPVYYVLAYDSEHCIKDVTSRYACTSMSLTLKLRKDEAWWEEVLAPYAPRNKVLDKAEDSRLYTQQLKKPLPTTIGEYKNHPLYALKRHLLKFEVIYPSNAVPAGFIRGEPVYHRECVCQVHTRETWMKEGRAVRVKEQSYKLVKARKMKSRKSFEIDVLAKPEEQQAECFGQWQTEQYMPPPAYNGKVPRNTYGNVEIFKPWMVPMGAVHLRIQGLNKVARKLDIDCAPAMVGWDFTSGFNYPVMDGFIVCEEHKEILLAAWDEEQEIQKEKAAAKREERAILNWKKMVKNLMLRERMKKRFDLAEVEVGVDGKRGPDEKAHDVQMAWPVNRPEVVKKLSTANQNTLFPSEDI